MKKYINLNEEVLAAAYNILYHANDRPPYARANQVREILAGEITPGCQAATWREFFDFLDANLTSSPGHPSPAGPGGLGLKHTIMNTIVITVDGQPVHEISVVSDDVNAADNLADKAAAAIKKGARVRKGDKVGKVASTLTAKPGHALVEWGDEITHERKDELAPAQPAPLSPAEWLECRNKEKYGKDFPAGSMPAYGMEEMAGMLAEYAAHIEENLHRVYSEAMDVEVDRNRMTVSAQNKIIEKATNQ